MQCPGAQRRQMPLSKYAPSGWHFAAESFKCAGMPTEPAAGGDTPMYTNYFLVRHQDLNHAGTLFGGRMLAWADELAYIAASLSFPGCTFVTKIFEKFDFIKGPGEGAIVRLDAYVKARGNSSVRIVVTGAWATDGQEIFTTEAVMVNAHGGHSVPIPG